MKDLKHYNIDLIKSINRPYKIIYEETKGIVMDKEYKDIHIIKYNPYTNEENVIHCERMCSCIEVRDNVITFHRRNDAYMNKIILIDMFNVKVVID